MKQLLIIALLLSSFAVNANEPVQLYTQCDEFSAWYVNPFGGATQRSRNCVVYELDVTTIPPTMHAVDFYLDVQELEVE